MGAHREVPSEARTEAATDPELDEAHQALVRDIVAQGGLTDPAWRAAFEEVERHLFVPYYYVHGSRGYERLWGEDPDPVRRRRWVRGVYGDEALATRMRDGELISSSSQPSLMALMLEALDVRDGHTVLEIGTGPGYNAALLSHRLGDTAVTSVDLDPEITDAARGHLAAAGYRPTVITGDGARGCPQRAPYDRIIATCTLPSVPSAWPEQCSPGARILAPVATGLVSLEVRATAHGPRAEGHFLHTPAYFVPLRGASPLSEPVARPGGVPRRAIGDELFRFLLTLTAGSLDPRDALSLWEREERPQRERYGVTVAEGRQWAWLDDPEGPYTWSLGV
ncbi:methyltransferase domain-containing protein [Streptomyces sp. ME02-6991-2A]|uniref:methyltransferase domain-containing protein n=1 Tax=Streptomyces sp. ME02-6991-2A TaxID=3028677 RepID=UPI0029A2B5AB|nr:methyltransferase domain-containing protein [Streptomyces sp. ME02-6991-2A]MDX3374954.1 methyltransferase domain-containing protein [Streptomyces sp. ME02-6991-2A]